MAMPHSICTGSPNRSRLAPLAMAMCICSTVVLITSSAASKSTHAFHHGEDQAHLAPSTDMVDADRPAQPPEALCSGTVNVWRHIVSLRPRQRARRG